MASDTKSQFTPITTSAPPRDWSRWLEQTLLDSWRPYVWLAFAVILLYVHTLRFTEFTHQDDHYLIVDSNSLLSNSNHIWKAFMEDVYHRHQGGNIYRPMLTLSLMVDTAISGTSLISYRITNILLHIGSVFLLLVFLRALGLDRLPSVVATMLFAIHPALTQAVVWIPGRNDSLFALFALASLLALHRYNVTARVWWVAVHVLLFAFTLFTKETALVLPFFCVLLFWSNQHRGEQWTVRIVLFISWLAVVIVWLSFRSAAMLAPVGDWQYIFTSLIRSSWVSLAYFGSAILPTELFIIAVAEDLSVFVGALGLLLLLLAIRSRETNWKLFCIGLLWFLAFLLPTFYQQPNVLVPLRFFQHRLYVPLIGILLMILSLSSWKFEKRWSGIATTAATLVLLSFGVMAFRQSFVFQNSLAFSEVIARTSPHNPFVYNDIGIMKYTNGSLVPARQQRDVPALYRKTLTSASERLQRLLATDPRNPSYHHHLAILYFGRGMLKSAEEHLMRSLTLDSTNAHTHYNAGVLYYRAHRELDAETHWKKAIELDPSLADAYRNLCYLYYRWKRFSLARAYGERAQQLGAAIPLELLDEITRQGREHNDEGT